MALSDEDVREILRIIDESDLDEIQIETRGFRLHVLRGDAAAAAPPPASAPASSPASTPEPSSAPQQPDSTASAGPAMTIDAPMLGIFYVADGPGQDPFVEPGDRVEPETVVGIIEVMKMMNSVRAGVSGKIVEVCAENGEQVEEGDPLFRVKPA